MKRFGTNEKLFIDILTNCSTQEIQLLLNLYEKHAAESLLQVLIRNLVENVKKL